MRLYYKNLLNILLLILLAGCGGTVYQDSASNNAISTFSVQDQKQLIDSLTKKMLNNVTFQSIVGNERPTILIDTINNKTAEHIDTESITDTLKSTIVRSHLFSVVSREKIDLLANEQALSQSGLTDKEHAVKLGKLLGAKYALYGNFSDIVNYNGNEKQTYYKLTIIVQNIETGEEIWIDEAEINKVSKKGLF